MRMPAVAAADYKTIRVGIDGPATTVTLHRPEQLNAATSLMVEELYDALSRVASEQSVRVVVLTGTGRGFCPGADLHRFGNHGPELPNSDDPFRIPVLLHQMPPVTVAAINGACAGAGLGWAAACDFRFAATSARFNSAFLNVAVAGDMGLPWSLPRLVGAARARELSFFPDTFSADEALRIGLVSRVFSDDAFRLEVLPRVKRLTVASPQALRALKEHYVAAEATNLEAFIVLETNGLRNLIRSPESLAAFRSFAKRSKPNAGGSSSTDT